MIHYTDCSLSSLLGRPFFGKLGTLVLLVVFASTIFVFKASIGSLDNPASNIKFNGIAIFLAAPN